MKGEKARTSLSDSGFLLIGSSRPFFEISRPVLSAYKIEHRDRMNEAYLAGRSISSSTIVNPPSGGIRKSEASQAGNEEATRKGAYGPVGKVDVHGKIRREVYGCSDSETVEMLFHAAGGPSQAHNSTAGTSKRRPEWFHVVDDDDEGDADAASVEVDDPAGVNVPDRSESIRSSAPASP